MKFFKVAMLRAGSRVSNMSIYVLQWSYLRNQTYHALNMQKNTMIAVSIEFVGIW